MKLSNFGIFFMGLSGVALAESEFPCQLPVLKGCLISSAQQSLPQPALPVVLTQATQTGGSVSTAVSMVTAVGPTQVAQNARAGLTLDLLACDEGLPVQEDKLAWPDNPTQLTLGNDWLQYHFGAVVGNWALMSGATAVWVGVAHKMGAGPAHFPGSLILPVLFLICPTTASAVTLLRDGNVGQQATGAVSLFLSLAGAGFVGAVMHPKFFKARWEHHEREWVALTESKSPWVEQYGELFETYGSGRQWYIVVELLTSMAVGSLKSYQVLEQNCGRLLWSGAAIYDAYALSQLAFRPNKNRHVQMFYTGIAGLQAVALTTQAIASVATSEETQQKVKTVTQSIVAATEYLMMVKTLFDIGLRFKDWYERFYHPKVVSTALVTLPSTSSQDFLREMLTVPVLLKSESESSFGVDSGSSVVETITAIPGPAALELFNEPPDLASDELLELCPGELVNSMFSLGESKELLPRTLNEEIEKAMAVFEDLKTNHVEL